MAITISGENNNDRILASDGVLDSISGINAVGVVTATSFTGDLTGDVTGNIVGNLTGNVNHTSNLLFQIGGSEKVRLDTSGRLLIGTTTEGHVSGDDLTIGTSGNTGMTIRSGTSSFGSLFFSDGTSGNDELAGAIEYNHNGDYMQFRTGASEKLRIASGGDVTVNTGTLYIPQWISHVGDTDSKFGFLQPDIIQFQVAGTQRLKIMNTGQIRIDQATSANNGIRMRPSGWSYDFRMGAVSSSGGSIWLGQNYEPTGGTRDSASYGTNYIRFTTQGEIMLGTGATDTNPSERLRISSSGQIGLGGANYGTSGQVLTSQGSGSAATWTTITGTTINNNADNRLITGSGTANTLNGEANFTYNSTLAQLTTSTSTNNTELLRLQNSHTDGKMTVMGFNTDGLGYSQTRIYGGNDNSGAAGQQGDSGAGKFKVTITNPSGTHQEVIYAENDANTASKFVRLSTSGSERLRINHSGDVGINYSGVPVATLDIRTDRDPSNGLMCFIRNNAQYGNGAYYGMDINSVGTWSMGMPDNTNVLSFRSGGQGGSGTERLRLDTSGRLGISHDLSGTANYNRLMIHNPHDGSCWLQMTSTGTGTTANTDGLSIGLNTSNIAHFWLRENAEMQFATNGTKRWTITNTGDLIPGGNYDVGMSSNAAFKMREVHSNKFVHRYGNSGSATNNQQEAIWYGGGITVMHDNATLQTTNYTWGLTGSRGYALIRIRNNAGSPQAIYAEAGSISSGSDYRMKENIEEITNGIETVKKLKPSIYNIRKTFNPNDDGKKHHGFIAHEVQEAIPNIGNIVSGVKDGMEEVFYQDEDENIPEGKKPGDSTGTFTDNPDMQGIDYGHITPVLAAAIKELITKVETLEAEVATLKGS